MNNFQTDVEPYHPWTLESIQSKYNAMLAEEKKMKRRVLVFSWIYSICMFIIPIVIWTLLLLMPNFKWNISKVLMLSLLTGFAWVAAIVIYNSMKDDNK